MNLGKYFKAPHDRKRYSIDYTDWLDIGETVSDVTFEVTPNTANVLVIDGVSIDPNAKGVVFYASEGLDGKNYKVIVHMETSGAQHRDDTVQYVVRAP
jgi:hypothetical protein